MRTAKILGRIFVLVLIFSLLPGNRASSAPATELPVLVGIYPSAGLSNTVNEIKKLDTWLGAPTVSIAGSFIDLESPEWFILAELNASWDAGYIPFVNLGAGKYPWANPVSRSAFQIANGAIDLQIRNWARVYKNWSNNGEKRAMIAPLQEMNGEWNTYGLDAPNFKLAYYRIQQLFAEEGVARQSVLWVFAPNGYANPGHEFERYYPGNSFVDAVGFSSFNFGNCPTFYPRWETYTQIYKPYLDRMAVMAPGKPIFIAEIGTVAEGGPTKSIPADKNTWLSDTLTNLASYPGLRGWVYFNLLEATNRNLNRCLSHGDYRIYQDYYSQNYDAFKATVTNPSLGYSHWSNTAPEVNSVMFNPANGIFEDVWPASTFSGLNSIWYADWVNRLARAGITGGCSTNVIGLPGSVTDPTIRYYCPDNSVSRAQMAVFLERGIHGTSYLPSPATGTIFTDVASNYWASAWIEQLSRDGITGGCAQNVYCPDNIVTRAQMAVFLLKSKYGTGYTPPAATGAIFADVPASYWASAWIEQLAAEGITSGCGSNIYCPDSPVTRAQMAVFLVKTFSLP